MGFISASGGDDGRRYNSRGFSMVPVCASRNYQHSIGNRPYSAYLHYLLFPLVLSVFAGAIAGNRHYKGNMTVRKYLIGVLSIQHDCVLSK